MAHVLIMPRQGNTVESCVIVRWKAAEGAAVSADQAVCEVETDKASFEVPAGVAGVLLKILRPEGDDVPVLEPIGVVGAPGEDWAAAVAGSGAASGASAPAAAEKAPAVSASAAGTASAAHAPPSASKPVGDSRASPRARRLAASEGIDFSGLAGSGPGGRVIERDVAAAIASRPPLTAAARAAALAGTAIPPAGSAIGGRAGLSDLAAGPQSAAAPRAETARAFQDGHSDTPVKGIRRLIAERISASLRNQAQLTLSSSAPAARLQALRARFKASDPVLGLSGVTIGDLVLFAVSRVLPGFPNMNAHFLGETIRSFERVHLGLAVDTPRGLMVPVIRNADLLSLAEISAEAKRLAAACQGGSVSPDELSGSSFTVTNLGAFGIESFTPVLNAPEVGILGLCSIAQRPVAAPEGGTSFEPRIGLSLTIDHQAVDGAPGARFLEALAKAIADIDLLLMK